MQTAVKEDFDCHTQVKKHFCPLLKLSFKSF